MEFDLASNRSFKYGDGLFETLKVVNGRILFLEQHLNRLSKGFEVLAFQKKYLDKEIFNSIIQEFLSNKKGADHRVRISFFREAGGLYTPHSSEVNYIIESTALTSIPYQLNNKGLDIGICPTVQLSCDILSNLKTCSALPYVLAGLYKKEQNWDDCLLLNSHNRIAESIAANVFLVVDGELRTPQLTEGCVMGVMRNQVIRIAQELGLVCKEIELDLEELNLAQEVFFTNAIRGLQWVESIKSIDKKYTNSTSLLLTQKLNATNNLKP
ncbi:MAG: 4-amino-4-deoxychorismate lyase [Aureispira sp.]|nr:4-amino-4-deoxychorismate lyase [Aureispira sp.]